MARAKIIAMIAAGGAFVATAALVALGRNPAKPVALVRAPGSAPRAAARPTGGGPRRAGGTPGALQEPLIVYLQPPPAGRRRRPVAEEPQPVGYIFLPDTHTAISPHGGRLRATATPTQVLRLLLLLLLGPSRPSGPFVADGARKQELSTNPTSLGQLPDISSTTEKPEFERKFLPFLPCWPWGGDQVVCTDDKGKTTVTIIMEDGTTKPGDDTDTTFEMPGGFFKHPEEGGGECISSCDFYWAWTVAAGIPVALICICIIICICCICGWCVAYSGSASKAPDGIASSASEKAAGSEEPLLSKAAEEGDGQGEKAHES